MYKDLVEQITATTGTGAYTVSGSVTGRLSFANAFIDGDTYIPYVVTNSAGAFECGLGTWDEDTLSLARTVVLSSTNGNAAVNWTAGDKRIYVSAHSVLCDMLSMRHTFLGGSLPGATDDALDGYREGSLMFRGGDQQVLFICLDPTPSAAVWSEIPTVVVENGKTILPFSGAVYDPDCNSPPMSQRGLTQNAGTAAGNKCVDFGLIGVSAFTSNATPAKMAFDGDYATHAAIYAENTSCVVLSGVVTCIDGATGDCKSWTVAATVKTNGSGATTVAGGSSPATLYSSDASLNTAALAVVGGTNECALQVTGIAATNLTWGGVLKVISVADY